MPKVGVGKAMSPACQSLHGRREALSPPRSSHRFLSNKNGSEGAALGRSSPSYLYLKGNLFYFRYVFPKVHRDRLGHAEIRMSLETGYVREARARAVSLYSTLYVLLERGVMDYQELRQQLKGLLISILEGKNKNPISQSEIRERLNWHLRELLEQDDRNINPRPCIKIPGAELTSGQTSACHANILINLMDNPESLANIAIDAIPRLLSDGIFQPEEITKENVLQIVKSYLKIQITNHKIHEARARGDYLSEQAVFAAPYKPRENEVAAQSPNVISQSLKKTFLLSEFIEKYIEVKLSDGVWKKHSVPDHRGRLSYLIEILGDIQADVVSRDDMRRFREILRQLPPNRTKRKEYRDKSIEQIVAMMPAIVLNVKTVNMIVEAASSLFEWGVREGYLANNPAKSLSIKDDRQEIGLRETFDKTDLQKIFLCKKYINNEFKHPSFFWTPLVSLFTGMRLEEICQFRCEDVYESEIDGLFVIDINGRPSSNGTLDKTLKNKNATRLIPVHPILVEIGFIKYCSTMKKNKENRVFPELNKTAASPKYGKQPGKSFGKLIRDLKIEGNKTFHSFRHTFSDFYKKKDMQNDLFRQVFGHEISELAGRQYGSRFDVKMCHEKLISLLDYGIDFSRLRFVGK
jgi:integrase